MRGCRDYCQFAELLGVCEHHTKRQWRHLVSPLGSKYLVDESPRCTMQFLPLLIQFFFFLFYVRRAFLRLYRVELCFISISIICLSDILGAKWCTLTKTIWRNLDTNQQQQRHFCTTACSFTIPRRRSNLGLGTTLPPFSILDFARYYRLKSLHPINERHHCFGRNRLSNVSRLFSVSL